MQSACLRKFKSVARQERIEDNLSWFEKLIIVAIALAVALVGSGMMYVSTVGWDDYKQTSFIRDGDRRLTPSKTEPNRWSIGVVGLGLFGISAYVVLAHIVKSSERPGLTNSRSKRRTM